MPDAAVVADVSSQCGRLRARPRGRTPEETLRKGATISLDHIRSHDSTGRRCRREGQ
jgi:hypothetical protein